MNCYYCKGVDTVEQRNTRFCVYDIPNPFLVENVPALVCYLCGDKSFSGATVSALNKIKDGEAKAADWQTFPVFDFKELNKARNPEQSGTAHSANSAMEQV